MDKQREHLHDDLFDLTIIGASHLAHGHTDFSSWSKVMLAEDCTRWHRPFLRMIFVNANGMLKQIQKTFERLE